MTALLRVSLAVVMMAVAAMKGLYSEEVTVRAIAFAWLELAIGISALTAHFRWSAAAAVVFALGSIAWSQITDEADCGCLGMETDWRVRTVVAGMIGLIGAGLLARHGPTKIQE